MPGRQYVIVGIRLAKLREIQRGNSYFHETDLVATKITTLDEANRRCQELYKKRPTTMLYFVVPVGTLE